tara:strand:+ start:195 stop:1067 length:873 start_codon:yes stop_codon:yes gene_type:complete
MDRLLYLATEGFKNIWRHKMTTSVSIIILVLSLYLIGSLIILSDNTSNVLQYLRSKYKIEVFLEPEIDIDRANSIANKIREIPSVRSATIISKDTAIRIFKDQFGEDILKILGYNPLPISIVVNLNRDIDGVLKIEPIINLIKSSPGVLSTKHQGLIIRKIENYYSKILEKSIILIISISLIATLFIYNTIKLSVFSRKQLIRSMRLIGASSFFIKLPFIIEGLLTGIISSAITIILLMGTISGLNFLIFSFTNLNLVIKYDPVSFFWLTLLSGIICVLGGNRAISRVLK